MVGTKSIQWDIIINMKKLIALIIISFSVFIAASQVVLAKEKAQIPEENGIYNDPDHSGIKIRVFVHKEKPSRPSPTPSPVCNLDDPNSGSVDGITGWELSSTWIYNLNPSSVPSSVGGQNLGTIASRAFSEWSSAAKGNVNFEEGPTTTINRQAYDGNNIVAWGRTSGSALAVTYTRYIQETGQVVDVDTIMNNKFVWSWTDQTQNLYCALSNTYDAQDILTHELGHWMGLNDEYTTPFVDNTMYGYGSKAEVKKDTLTTGDIQTVSSIY